MSEKLNIYSTDRKAERDAEESVRISENIYSIPEMEMLSLGVKIIREIQIECLNI